MNEGIHLDLDTWIGLLLITIPPTSKSLLAPKCHFCDTLIRYNIF